jgi:hypothetical protein
MALPARLQVGQTGIGRVYSGYITNRVPAWKKRPRKIRRGLVVLAVAAGAMLSGCLFSVPIPLAPGAEQVSVTHNSSQVASCTPVGNIDARIGVELADSDRIRAMQNQAVG